MTTALPRRKSSDARLGHRFLVADFPVESRGSNCDLPFVFVAAGTRQQQLLSTQTHVTSNPAPTQATNTIAEACPQNCPGAWIPHRHTTCVAHESILRLSSRTCACPLCSIGTKCQAEGSGTLHDSRTATFMLNNTTSKVGYCIEEPHLLQPTLTPLLRHTDTATLPLAWLT